MSKIKNGGLDQYGTVPFEQQQFGTACVEGVNSNSSSNGCICIAPPTISPMAHSIVSGRCMLS